jgi:hypothetical protein
MHKLSNLLLSATVITSLSSLLAVPAQAQIDLLRSFCDGYLQGAAITGDYSSVPDDCRQYMRPSSSQRSNRRDSDRYVEQQELRNRQIQRDADINLESNQDSNCLASSEGCVRIRY